MQTMESPKLEERLKAGVQTEPDTKQRINIPINLGNWKHLPEAISEQLLWFHQHCLETGLTKKEAGEAINYDASVVHRVLYGEYQGNYANIADAIRSYRKIVLNRAKIQHAEFRKNRNTKLICEALDYAMSANTMTLIQGESGTGKSITSQWWRDHNNSGRTAYVSLDAFCSTTSLTVELCGAIGANASKSLHERIKAIQRAFNKNRMLIIDEAQFLLPCDRRSIPRNLELLRTIHDKTRCALALIATARFGDDLEKSEYQFEQVLGRVDPPCRLYRTLSEEDILPILEQYSSRPSEKMIDTCLAIANQELPEYRGRLRAVTAILRNAMRQADGSKITEGDFLKALAVRKRMMGEFQYAKH